MASDVLHCSFGASQVTAVAPAPHLRIFARPCTSTHPCYLLSRYLAPDPMRLRPAMHPMSDVLCTIFVRPPLLSSGRAQPSPSSESVVPRSPLKLSTSVFILPTSSSPQADERRRARDHLTTEKLQSPSDLRWWTRGGFQHPTLPQQHPAHWPPCSLPHLCSMPNPGPRLSITQTSLSSGPYLITSEHRQ